MERILIALDATPASLKGVHYLARFLKCETDILVTLFHAIPTTSPNLLKRDEVRQIEQLHEEHPHLAGYFWQGENEREMRKAFDEARAILAAAGFPASRIETTFNVQTREIAEIIIDEARSRSCSTVVVARHRQGRVKKLLLGSVSDAVTKLARELTVWVVDY